MYEYEARAPKRPRLQLIEARHARQLSQQALANELGTTHVNVSRWERGITKPTPYFRSRLCRFFGKTETELDLLPQQRYTAESNDDQQEASPVLRLSLSNLNNGKEHVVLLAVEEQKLTLKQIS